MAKPRHKRFKTFGGIPIGKNGFPATMIAGVYRDWSKERKQKTHSRQVSPKGEKREYFNCLTLGDFFPKAQKPDTQKGDTNA